MLYPERLWPLLAHLLELQASGFEVTCLPGLYSRDSSSFQSQH